MNLFESRRKAGKELAGILKDFVEIDVVITPFPEAADIGAAVAKSQDAENIFRPADFIDSPKRPHIHIGAVVDDGTLWIDDGLRQELQVSSDYISEVSREKAETLHEQSSGTGIRRALKGERVAIVSDGIADGFREAAVAGSLLKESADEIYIVAPFKSRNVMADIGSLATAVMVLKEVPFVRYPGDFYARERKTTGYNSKAT